MIKLSKAETQRIQAEHIEWYGRTYGLERVRALVMAADDDVQTEAPGDGRDWGTRNSINVVLPGAGRYLRVLFHDGQRRIEKLSFSDSISALAALDCRAVAYTHLTAAAL